MAQTGFCDSRPLPDLHKKAEERCAPLRTWANSCPLKESRTPSEGEKLGEPKYQTEQTYRWVRRLPLSAEDGIIMDYAEQNGSLHQVTGCERKALMDCLTGLSGLQSLTELLPGLLHRELERAMSKMGLICDRTFAWDVFTEMMRTQLRCAFPNADLPPPFTDAMRAILVDWLVKVHMLFHFSEETLYLAVHLLNQSLRRIKVSIASLQLLGMVCLFLAAKKEECLLPEVSELCYLMQNAYSKAQLLRMERRVLCGLRFELSHCPPLHFLLLTASIARCSDKVVLMARYLLELSLLEGQCVVYLPAQLAGAAVCLARRILQEPPTPESEAAWCIASSIHVGSEASLLSIMEIMAVAAARADSRETRATFIKFSTADTLYVSIHPGLKTAPSLYGLSSPQT